MRPVHTVPAATLPGLAGADTTAAVPMPPPPGEPLPAQEEDAAPASPGATASVDSASPPAQEPLASEQTSAAAEDDEDDEDEAGGEEGDEGEASEAAANPGVPGLLYTADLSDEELKRRWKDEPQSLGSVSVGFVESGRLVNGVRFPDGGQDWIVVSPEKTYATEETITYLSQVIRAVRAALPDAPPLRVNQISAKEGGYMRPHKSHQSGRDVDLGFYYPTAEPIRARDRENHIHLARNWALVKALLAHADVQLILVDRRVQKVLYEYALKSGEDKAWLDSLFHAGFQSLIRHARGHRDHFHVRFFSPRAQELGRRLAPLLALQPEQNIAMHRVRSGDTLGAIALRYNSTVNGLRKSNHLRGNLLRIGQVLSVPLRGPCTRCPVPPPFVVPPRRLAAVTAPENTLTAGKQEHAAPSAEEPEETPAREEPKPQSPTVVGTPTS
ncbi:LysM peptidoglycan-binding domain-containing protein [Stigmatella aurantiaca]|uniref:LysM peptidoglycan-binding domain-containing protein n=1 Tax=Stigmatella aurantiaca TaxID=41 RepID=UPI0003107F87|nr:penicillin-insensitive murein endopeptidase [Stigmatella aurantiaca]